MLVHWHAETGLPEDELLLPWLTACLTELAARERPDLAVLSWGPPDEPVTYRTLGRGDVAGADSWEALARLLRAEVSVVVRTDGASGGTVTSGAHGRYPRRAPRPWSWAAPTGAAAPGPILYPRLSPRWPASPTLDHAHVALLADAGDAPAFMALHGLRARIQSALPDTTVTLAGSSARYVSSLGNRSRPQRCWAKPDLAALAGCSAVVLGSAGIEWAPVALEALAAGCRVIAPADARYASYLDGDRGDRWDPAGDGLDVVSLLQADRRDPESRSSRCRRAAAWARRWTLSRAANELAQLALAPLPPSRSTRTSREHWVLRREIGIGDILFALCVAAALKRRDPHCHLTFHTAPAYREWVSWFHEVDRVTVGDFAPAAGARVADFERDFPGASMIDRATAMGRQAGVVSEWPSRPQLPAALLRRARTLLPLNRRPKIALAPTSKAHAVTRSLPAAAAQEVARQLSLIGEVIWLSEEAANLSGVPGVTDLSGSLTTPEVFAVLAHCDACVSVDSGLLYAAAALGKPVVGLFTHIGALQRLWLAPAFIALQPSMPCAPCGEGPDAFHCRPAGVAGASIAPPCIQIPWAAHLLQAVQQLLAASGPTRQVWNVALGGERLIWDPATLPAPWGQARFGAGSNSGPGAPAEIWGQPVLPPAPKAALIGWDQSQKRVSP